MKLYSRTNVLCISKYPNFTRESKFPIKFWNDSTVDTPNFLYFIWAFNLINAAFLKRTCLLWAVYSAPVVILLSRIYVLFFVCLGIRSQFTCHEIHTAVKRSQHNMLLSKKTNKKELTQVAINNKPRD